MKSNVNHRKFRNFFISKELQLPMAVAHLAYIILVAAALIATVLSPFYTDIFKTGDLCGKAVFRKNVYCIAGAVINSQP